MPIHTVAPPSRSRHRHRDKGVIFYWHLLSFREGERRSEGPRAEAVPGVVLRDCRAMRDFPKVTSIWAGSRVCPRDWSLVSLGGPYIGA